MEDHVLLSDKMGGLPILFTDVVSSQVDPHPLRRPPALVHQAVGRGDDVPGRKGSQQVTQQQQVKF